MPRASSAVPGFVYVPDLGPAGAEVELSPDESHHVARVCRAGTGTVVEATDGRGARARLVILATGRAVRARIEHVEQDVRLARAWVISGAPEGARVDWMIEKLAELGVERWLPVDTERAAWPQGARRSARWERIAVAALKQSRSSHLLEIDPPVRLAAVLEALPASERWLAAESGPPGTPGTEQLAVVAVGPASGFDSEEIERLRAAQFRDIGLGPMRLRTETAAIAWAALWASRLGGGPVSSG